MLLKEQQREQNPGQEGEPPIPPGSVGFEQFQHFCVLHARKNSIRAGQKSTKKEGTGFWQRKQSRRVGSPHGKRGVGACCSQENTVTGSTSCPCAPEFLSPTSSAFSEGFRSQKYRKCLNHAPVILYGFAVRGRSDTPLGSSIDANALATLTAWEAHPANLSPTG